MSARRFLRLVGVLSVALSVNAMAAAPVSAGSVSDKQAEANRIAAQIDALGAKESALAEQYDGNVLKEQQVTAQVADAQVRLDRTAAQAAQAGAVLRGRAIDTYVRGSVAPDLTTVARAEAKGTDPLMAVQYAHTLASSDAAALDKVRAVHLNLADERAALDAAQRQARAAVAGVDQARGAVTAAQAQLEQTLAQVKGQLADLVAQAQTQREAAATAAAQATLAAAQRAATQQPQPAAASVAGPVRRVVAPIIGVGAAILPRLASAPAPRPVTGPPPAAKSGASAALAYANAQLGKPYQWGAAGPGAFDCSGLTMMAWRAGGVSLPHNAAAQYGQVRHISMADLQPGDLVFESGLGHVGIYIGGGQMIDAPHSGAVVRVSALWGSMNLAGRP